MLEHFAALLGAAAARPTSRRPNVLTLAPEGAERSGNPWHVHEYRAERVPRAVRGALRPRRAATASSTRGKLRAHQVAIERLGWDAVHAAARASPSAFYDRFTPAISRATSRSSARASATSTGRSTSWRSAAREPRGRVSLVLHTHMPYVEGFGTWPFGEEWLWEAIATSYLPLLDLLDAGAPLTLSLTPGALRPARGARARSTAARPSCATCAPPRTALDIDALPRGGRTAPWRPSSSAPPASTPLRWRGWRRSARTATCSRALAPHAAWTSSATHAVLPLLATDAGVRLQVQTGIEAHRARFGDGWRGGFWLPECAHAPWLRRLLEEAGVHATCVDLTDVLGPGDRAPPDAAAQRGRAAARADRPRARSTSSGATAATRRTAPIATTTTARRATTARGPTTASVYDPERGRSRRRARDARDFVARVRGARARAAGCAAARSTPSCSATGGTRARRSSRAFVEACAELGLALVPLDDALADVRAGAVAGRAATPRRRGARRATCGRGRARRSPTWPARSATPSCASSRAGRGRARARGARAARAPGQRLGVPGDPRRSPAPTPASAFAGHLGALDEALEAVPSPDPRSAEPRADAAHRTAPRAVSRVLILSWEYPPLDRGRPRPPRAQARRAARRAGTSTSTS